MADNKHRTKAKALIQRVLDGDISLTDIRGVDAEDDRTYAAIGWMLLNRDNYLDEANYVRAPFERTMQEITGRRCPNDYSYYSRRAGLHESHSHSDRGVPSVSIKVTRRHSRDVTSPDSTYVKMLGRIVKLTPP